MPDPTVNPNEQADLLIRDPVTDAYSRALLENRLEKEIGRARRYGTRCVLCLFDIDHFKSVNDAYGHKRGDQILRELTVCVQAGIRDSDLLFRYGGDEFVLLLPETHKEQAFILCQRLFDKIRAIVFEGDPPLSLSISMGIASFPADGADGSQLLQVADQRSYIAKRQGRNRFIGEDAAPQPILDFDSQDRLVEREAASDILQAFFQQLAGKTSGLLAVTGQPGSGRTRLLEYIAQVAQMHQYELLSLRGTRAVRRRPYGVFMAARWPVALPVTSGISAIDSALKQGLAQKDKTRLLVAIDDVNMIDRGSLELLRHLLAASEIPELVVAYTSLPGPTKLMASGVAAVKAEIGIAPLSRDGLKIWLRQLFKSETPADFFDWLYRQTEGFPGRVRIVLTALMTQELVQLDETGLWKFNPNFVAYSYAPAETGDAPLPGNLPVSLTDFVGRDKLSWELDQLLNTRRLITLVGPGGIGKTRLALELAAARQDLYPDGVWFIPLETIRTAEAVILAVARTFGLRSAESRALLDGLKDFLRDKSMLLVLDNFEQVLDAAAVVAEILATAPQVQILVTSRELLHVSGEQVFNVPPLNMPDLRHLPNLTSLEQIEAVALFIDRARQVKYDFTLTEANAPIVAEICTRLDGLPLAIELAAARTNQFSLRKLADQLQHRLTALVNGPSNLTTRQRTMRDAIHWSYGLLSPAEQGLFARQGVFWGGCDLFSAEKVCSEEESRGRKSGNGISELAVATIQPALTALVNKSLLYLREGKDGELHYNMLEAIHEYAVEQLELSGEVELLRRRHAWHYLERVEEAEPHLTGPDQLHWLDQLEGNRDNLQAALDWFCRQDEVEPALRFAAATWKFWQIRSYYHAEGQQWMQRVLALGGEQAKGLAPATRAKVLWGASRLADDVGDFHRAAQMIKESLAISTEVTDVRGIALAQHALATIIERRPDERAQAEALYLQSLDGFRSINDLEDIGWTLLRLGSLYYGLGRYAQAVDYYEQSRAIFDGIGQKRAMAVSIMQLGGVSILKGEYENASALLNKSLVEIEELGDVLTVSRLQCYLGQMAFQKGEYAAAQAILEKCLRIAHSNSDEWATQKSLSWLGATFLALGDVQQAKTLLEEALPIARRVNFQVDVNLTLELLGHVMLAVGDADRAVEFYRESLELYWNYPLVDIVPENLEGLALLAATQSSAVGARRAARLLGAADALRREHRFPRSAFAKINYERTLAMLPLHLSEKAAQAAQARGAAMTVQQAIAYAMGKA